MRDPSVAQELATSLQREDLTIEELVTRADEMLSILAPQQTRYKVKARPDVRTVRYYTSKSLLPKPVSYDGGRARYSGTHLVRLLLIKKMQAEHHTLTKIAKVLGGADDHEVLQALLPNVGPAKKPAATHLLPAASPQPDGGDLAPFQPERTRRLSLTAGASGAASIHIAETILDDPAQRRVLADALEKLAHALRAGPKGDVS